MHPYASIRLQYASERQCPTCILSESKKTTVCTVTDTPGIQNICHAYLQFLTNIGHRFGQQSGHYESSGYISAAILNAFAFRVCLLACFQTTETRALNIYKNEDLLLKRHFKN